MGITAGQIGRHVLELLQPEVFLRLYRFAAGMGLQTLGPGLERRGLGRQRLLAVEALQVLEEHPPGHAIHHQVVHDQQQALGTIGQFSKHRTQQGPLLQVEAALGFFAQRGQLVGIRHRGLPQHLRGGGCMLGPPPFGGLAEAQAQPIVVVDDGVQGRLQSICPHRLAWHQQQGLVPVVALRQVHLEEQLLERQQRRLALHRALVKHLGNLQLRHPRQAAHGLVLEQRLGGEMDTGGAGAADHLDRNDRVSAALEEVVVQAHLFDTQHLGPDRRDLLLQGTLRGFVVMGGFGFGQGLAVEFAVGAQGHLLQQHPLCRDHVVRQVLGQVGAEDFAPIIGSVLQHQVAHQVFTVDRQHGSLTDPRVFQQARFDFSQLDAQAAQLDLMVDTPGIFDHAVCAVACQVAGAVQALALDERVGDKTFGSECRAAVVTPGQADAAEVQLAEHADWYGLEVAVEDVAAEVGDRAANWHRIAAFVHAGPVGHVDGGFGRAVQVVEPGLGQLGENLLLGIHRQGLTAAYDALQALAGRHRRILQEGLQHRRHEVQRGDLLLIDQVDQPGRITVITGRCNHQARTGHQRPEELPHRHVEAERGLLQHRVAGVQGIGFLHPVQAVQQCRMTVAGAFGLAGGARGVDHVGEVFAVQGDAWVGVAVALEGRLAQHQGFQALGNGQLFTQMRLGQKQFHPAVVQHVGQAFARVFRVQRHVGATGLEHREQAHDHFNGALQRQADQHVRSYAGFDQAMGQAVGAAVQLGITERRLIETQRRCIRLRLHLGLDHLMHPLPLGVVARGGVPLSEYLLALSGVECRQVVQGQCRIRHGRPQQAQPMFGHARDGGGAEQVGGVGQGRPDRVAAFLGIQAQVELGAVAVPFQVGHAQAR